MARYSTKHMQTFCTVVECGGFVNAQAALGMSQPAISTHIRDFEVRLGFQLCLRGRSGFTLTEKGELVYQKCRDMLNQLSDFDAELGELRNTLTGTIRIGVIDNTITNAEFSISRVIERFFARQAQANDVAIKLDILPPDALERELMNGSIHIGIGPFQRSGDSLSYDLIYKERHSFYCAEGHPLFHCDDATIRWETLQQYAVSTRAYLQTSDLPGIKNRVFVSNMEAQAMLINSGHYLGYLPEHYAQHWVQGGTMRAINHLGLEHDSTFYLATRKSTNMRNIIKVFIDDLRAEVAS